MRRADRLFQVVQIIRSRRLTTAAFLAERLEISSRSVYRDVAALQTQGVPIEGEAGVGYRMRRGFDLPPMMFSSKEAQALVLSVRIAQSRIDPTLAAHAEDALGKILSVLPALERVAVENLSLHAPPFGPDPGTLGRVGVLREAVDDKRKLRLDYLDLHETPSMRTVHPLGCFFWGNVWTVVAWCEIRGDFRHFRVDRIQRVDVLEERFRDEPGKTLRDFLRTSACEDAP